MLGQRTPRSVVAYSSQMFAEATPEVSSSLTGVKNSKWVSAAGYGIDKILGMTSEMVLTLYRIAFALARKPWARSIETKFQPVRPGKEDHLKRGVFSKLFRLDRTDPLSFGPKFPEKFG